jgi:hypothetical protein
MWSLRCLLIGHDDMLLRRPHRLSLQCSHCGRETKGWNLSPSDQEAMNTWVQVGEGIPAAAAVSWALDHFFDWRRRLLASLSRTTSE